MLCRLVETRFVRMPRFDCEARQSLCQVAKKLVHQSVEWFFIAQALSFRMDRVHHKIDHCARIQVGVIDRNFVVELGMNKLKDLAVTLAPCT